MRVIKGREDESAPLLARSLSIFRLAWSSSSLTASLASSRFSMMNSACSTLSSAIFLPRYFKSARCSRGGGGVAAS